MKALLPRGEWSWALPRGYFILVTARGGASKSCLVYAKSAAGTLLFWGEVEGEGRGDGEDVVRDEAGDDE